MESQRKKDEYKQMLLQVMQQHADDETIAIPESQEELQKESSKKEDFYDFRSDDEGSSCIEVEANEYLSNAKIIECLHKYPTIKTVSYVQYCVAIKCSCGEAFQFRRCSVDTKAKQID